MKYINDWNRHNEELTFTKSDYPFERGEFDMDELPYTTVVDEVKYKVTFYKVFTSFYDNAWGRSYDDVSNTDIEYSQSNKNPLKIINAITCITEDFLRYLNVEVLLIQHMNMNNEIVSDKLNKRSRINFKYLNDIRGYKTKYFNMLGDTTSLTSICILYRDDVDITPITEHFNSSPYKHIEIINK
jgi:hypothetical protein